jgi:two-component system chemotaxis response regulator CheY
MNMAERKLTAIVVDDDIDTVELFSEYLELQGIKVLAKGYDGNEAIELYKKLNPDFSFLDVMMPHYDGTFALQEIKQLNPLAKVIMVTADLTADTAHRLESAGASAVVYKPFEFEEIMSTIHRLIQPNSVTM